MTKRENILRALRRQQPEYVPWSLSLCDSQLDRLEKESGTRNIEVYFDLPSRNIEINPTRHPNDYSAYFENLEQPEQIDEIGVGYVHGSVAHFARMIHPMEPFTSPEQVWAFPLPDALEDYRWEGFAERVQAAKDAGLAAVYFAVQIFEPAWYLRGMDTLLMDMLEESPMAAACLDRMTEYQTAFCRKLARAGIDIIVYGDDVGTQRGMMMSPEVWRQWLKPTMQKAIQAAKEIKPDIIAYYHTDGNVYDIIPELIEIGVDVLNPVQPECMDPALLKQLYGDRLSFWGTIGTQTTLPFGSVRQVEDEVAKMIQTVGQDGGLLLSPSHLIEPEVPWESIVAFVEAVKRLGRYPIV